MAKAMDPQVRLLLETAFEAFQTGMLETVFDRRGAWH
jgi:hypothetical protein